MSTRIHLRRAIWLSRIDLPLLYGTLAICALSVALVYSATGGHVQPLYRHLLHISIALVVMLSVAHVPIPLLRACSPLIYGGTLLLLVAVLLFGIVGKGAQRWLDVGLFRFQPAELMKIAVPMMVAWLMLIRPLPPTLLWMLLGFVVTALPVWLVIKQPDLGTSVLIGLSGVIAIFLTGMRWRWVIIVLTSLAVTVPALWSSLLHDYQRQRILTLFDPWGDPLGAGYHTIQSTIAIGSGGFLGKGWLSGSQSQLDFIPERSTDFIFPVLAEEFGLIGVLLLFSLYMFVVLRGIWIALNVRNDYTRIVVGCLSVTVFVNFFVNVGMVSGILPVVGLPLPLISYGGTSLVVLMIGFGIMMGARAQGE